MPDRHRAADAIERHSGFVAEASHSDGIVSFVMRDETPLIWPVFQRAMETLIALRGPDLLRIKGLLNLAGSKGPVVFQAVQHLIHPPVELSAWPDKDHSSRVVFITRGVSERQVEDLFKACRALGYSSGINGVPRRLLSLGPVLTAAAFGLVSPASLDGGFKSKALREAAPP